MNFEREKEQIKKELENLVIKCNRISGESKQDYVAAMPPSQTVIPQMYIYTSDAKEKIQEACKETKDNIKKILDQIYDSTTGGITAVPSEEDINTLTVLQMRSTLSISEVELYLDKYKDNVQVYSAICDIAKEKGIVLPTKQHESIRKANELIKYWEKIDFTINSFQAEKGRITDIMVIGFVADLDRILLAE